jgi:hypothetical protein
VSAQSVSGWARRRIDRPKCGAGFSTPRVST